MSEADGCLRALRRGGVVAVPTDTLYGLLADPYSASAMATLRRLKQATDPRPWPLLIPAGFDLSRLGCTLSESGQRLAARFWPGKITLIVPCTGTLARLAGRLKDGAVGIRVPGGPQGLIELLGLWDGPLTGTSANPQGCSPAEDSEEVKRYFPDALEYVVPGQSGGGAPSTVVDTVTQEIRVERVGAVSEEMLREALCA